MQIPGESIGIIADDLTGACDTALSFHLEGANTRILLEYKTANETTSTQAWVVNTDSRHSSPVEASKAVRKAVHYMRENLHLDRFYKKIDSTLRGHIAQECLAILEELRWSAAIIAPAYPDEGRRTVGGYQIVRGLPVGHTETAMDPLFPVRESHIPTLLGRTSDPELVGHITLSKVMDGAGPIQRAILELIEQNRKLIVVDACSDVDLEQLSLAINKLPSSVNVLPCGSAGFAKALSRKWVLHVDRPVRPALKIAASPVLMVVGSANPRTVQQLKVFQAAFEARYPEEELAFLTLTPREILGLDDLSSTTARLKSLLMRNATVVLSTSFVDGNLKKTLVLAEELKLSPADAADRASQALAQITQAVMADTPAKLILSGGETAYDVCKSLGVKSLQVTEQGETSIPLMMDEQARWFVTKSGGFGSETCLVKLFETLRALELPKDSLV